MDKVQVKQDSTGDNLTTGLKPAAGRPEMLFDQSKAFDPQLDDLEYIDMSGANMLKSANSSKGLETSMDYKTSTPNSSRYLPRIEKHGEAWSNSLLQDLAPSLPNSPPESLDELVSKDFVRTEEEEDHYVTIHGSPTYLDPLCTSCLDTSVTQKDCTYQSITTVPGTPAPLQPPALPNRRHSCHIQRTDETGSQLRMRSQSDACQGVATRRKLPQLRPRADDVLSAVGTRNYTVQQVFDSVAELTSGMPDETSELSSENNHGVKRHHSSASVNNCGVPRKVCKRQSFSSKYGKSDLNVSSGCQMPSVCESPYHMDTYDTFSSCRLSQETTSAESHGYSAANDVKLPLTPKKDGHRRSFLEHIHSFSSVKLCRSKSKRTPFTEQSFYGPSKKSSVKSPFNRKSFMRISFRGFKRDKVADLNNNGHFPEQPRFDFGVYSGCGKETHF